MCHRSDASAASLLSCRRTPTTCTSTGPRASNTVAATAATRCFRAKRSRNAAAVPPAGDTSITGASAPRCERRVPALGGGRRGDTSIMVASVSRLLCRHLQSTAATSAAQTCCIRRPLSRPRREVRLPTEALNTESSWTTHGRSTGSSSGARRTSVRGCGPPCCTERRQLAAGRRWRHPGTALPPVACACRGPRTTRSRLAAAGRSHGSSRVQEVRQVPPLVLGVKREFTEDLVGAVDLGGPVLGAQCGQGTIHQGGRRFSSGRAVRALLNNSPLTVVLIRMRMP